MHVMALLVLEVHAAGELYYNITGLTMGTQYYVRITGHHSLVWVKVVPLESNHMNGPPHH